MVVGLRLPEGNFIIELLDRYWSSSRRLVSPDTIDCRVQIPEEEKITMQYAEIPGNSRREFYDGKFPGIPEREFPVALLDTGLKQSFDVFV